MTESRYPSSHQSYFQRSKYGNRLAFKTWTPRYTILLFIYMSPSLEAILTDDIVGRTRSYKKRYLTFL